MQSGDRVQLGTHEYEILELLGTGALGDAFRARRVDNNIVSVIKILRADKPEKRQEFELEIATLEKISAQEKGAGTHLAVRLLDSGEYQGRPFQIQELATGSPVILWRNLDEVEKLRVAAQFMQLLEIAHSADIALTDMKIDAIFWNGSTIHVIDWNATRSGRFEQQEDLFRAGALFYQLLTGEAVILDQDSATKRLQVPGQLGFGVAGWQNLTRGTHQILQRALHRDFDRRYPNAVEFRQDLAWWGDSLQSVHLAEWHRVEERVLQTDIDERFDRMVALLELLKQAPNELQARLAPLRDRADSELLKEIQRPIAFGLGQMRTGGYSQAEQEFSNAISLDPLRKDAYFYRAQTQLGVHLASAEGKLLFPQGQGEVLRAQVLGQVSNAVDLFIKGDLPNAETTLDRLPFQVRTIKQVELLRSFVSASRLENEADGLNRASKYDAALNRLREAYATAPQAGWLKLLIEQLEAEAGRRALIARKIKDAGDAMEPVNTAVDERDAVRSLDHAEGLWLEVIQLDPASRTAHEHLRDVREKRVVYEAIVQANEALDKLEFKTAAEELRRAGDNPRVPALRTRLNDWQRRATSRQVLAQEATLAFNSAQYNVVNAKITEAFEIVQEEPRLPLDDAELARMEKQQREALQMRDQLVRQEIATTLALLDSLQIGLAQTRIETAREYGPNERDTADLNELAGIALTIETQLTETSNNLSIWRSQAESSVDSVTLLGQLLQPPQQTWIDSLQRIGKRDGDLAFKPEYLAETRNRMNEILQELQHYQNANKDFQIVEINLTSSDDAHRSNAIQELDELIRESAALERRVMLLDRAAAGGIHWVGDREGCAWIAQASKTLRENLEERRLVFWQDQFRTDDRANRKQAAIQLRILEPAKDLYYSPYIADFELLDQLDKDLQSSIPLGETEQLAKLIALRDSSGKVTNPALGDQYLQTLDRGCLDLAKRAVSLATLRRALELVTANNAALEKEKQALSTWLDALDQANAPFTPNAGAVAIQKFPSPLPLDSQVANIWQPQIESYQAQLNSAQNQAASLGVTSQLLESENVRVSEKLHQAQDEIETVRKRLAELERNLDEAEKLAQNLEFTQAVSKIEIPIDLKDAVLLNALSSARARYRKLESFWIAAKAAFLRYAFLEAKTTVAQARALSFTNPQFTEFEKLADNALALQKNIEGLKPPPVLGQNIGSSQAIAQEIDIDNLEAQVMELEARAKTFVARPDGEPIFGKFVYALAEYRKEDVQRKKRAEAERSAKAEFDENERIREFLARNLRSIENLVEKLRGERKIYDSTKNDALNLR